MKPTIAFAAIAVVAARTCLATGIDKGPYLQNVSTTGITVCWVSSADSTGAVTYAQLLPGGRKAKAIVAKETKAARYHRVKLTGLKPYTQYEYSVECEGRNSGPAVFRSAALPSQPFHFAAYGDDRTQADKHAAVIARMIKFKPDFVIQSGDLVANGESEPQWDVFWATVKPLVRESPYYPALGNHEMGGAPYFRYFAVPREYSFDYGNTHFVALDSTRPASEYKAQEAWLAKDLAAHQKATWRIVFLHHTPYTCSSSASRRRDSISLRRRLEPIFMSGNVQLVVTGHDHNYQHHVANGIHYLVSGGGGAPLYDFKLDTPFTKTAKKAHHHCEISVKGDRMAIRAIEPDGTVIEEFGLTASRPSPRAQRPPAGSPRTAASHPRTPTPL